MIKEKINGIKTVKLSGVKFVIRKLTPLLFLDKENFPLNNIIENVKNNGELKQEKINEYKEVIKDIILKGVVSIKYWFEEKKIEDMIEDIMVRPELYNALFLEIINHSFGQKKNNFLRFFLTEDMRFLFTGWLKHTTNSQAK